ncbi:MAG TPA: translation initiation factor IF-3 [Solirubrobacterales bacterium]|nr:translation initiation factor IF-3 [Solirubrobacterales bacterium]
MPIPRRFDRRPPERDNTRINERIRVPKVRLIGADGEQVGIVDTDRARQMAREAELDLVEVAANAKPPVCRLLDYSKYKYEQEQKQKAARKHQTQVNVREIKLRPKIADNDYNTKKGHVERFLKHGDKVKVTIMFRGREQAHPDRGRDLLYRLYEDLGEELAVIESRPLQEGRNMSMLLGPSKEATRTAEADKQAKKSKGKGKNRGGGAPEVPDHPNAVAPDAIPDHPNAVAPDAEAPEPTEPDAADEAASPAEETAETSD